MPTVKVDVYRVEPTGWDDMVLDDPSRLLYVTDGHSQYGWSIRVGQTNSSRILTHKGQIRFDDRRYLRHWRYPLEEALAIAEKHIDTLRLNGRTAREANEWLIARRAELAAQGIDPATVGE